MIRTQPFAALVGTTLVGLMLVSGCGKSTTSVSNETTPETTETTVTTEATEPVDRTGQVLRHVVIFQFKDESSEEEVQGVADAFASLPEKIDTITKFEWGTNNSTEGFDDGFTHCFILSFASEKDRDDYIPHPAHSGEFADVLRPHMKKVFVIDYWATPDSEELEDAIQHVVFFKFNDDATPEQIKQVEQEFAALKGKIDLIKGFEFGINNSPEMKDDGFTHCFLVTFANEADRNAYLPHDEHMKFVDILSPVLDKVRVIDFKVQ